ncbi:MAG: aminoacyl-tRNA hydrolase [Hyphomicrobiales bacterium]|nr:aminoacyl-tRNA hydrolase [Hyphomicrobiales bacterium]
MLLIAGLGNPGSQHAGNRHNVGFMALDAIHRRHGFGPWRRKFQSAVSEGLFSGEKCLLIKPQTYMNESGRAVGEAARFYKLDPADVVVIHDEVDLAPGKIRMKAGGGVAGHNGLRSIGATLGSEFRRLRIGVGHPGVKEMVPIHVLHDFAKIDRAWLNPLLEAIADHAPLLAQGQDQTFSNRIHEATVKAKPEKKKKKQNKALIETAASTLEPPLENEDGPLARGLKKLFGR